MARHTYWLPLNNTLDAIDVNIAGGGGSGGTSGTDGDPFTIGTSGLNPMGGVVNHSDTVADGKEAMVALDGQRRMKVAGTLTTTPPTSATATTPTQTTVGTTAVVVYVANANRVSVTLQNNGLGRMYIACGAFDPTSSNYSFSLPACGSINDGSSPMIRLTEWKGEIRAINSAAGGLLNPQEFTP